MEEKIVLKTQIKNLKTALKESKENLKTMTQSYESEIEALKNRITQGNERFYGRLSEKEKDFEQKLKAELEERRIQEKTELLKALSVKEADANHFREKLKKLKEQLDGEKNNTEKMKIKLKNDFEESLRNQARAQISFEKETMDRVNQEKLNEIQRMKERYALDLEYSKYMKRKSK